MARWKATGEYIPNLTSNFFFVSGLSESRGVEVTSPVLWEVHLHQERAFCGIVNFVALTETSDGALESYW